MKLRYLPFAVPLIATGCGGAGGGGNDVSAPSSLSLRFFPAGGSAPPANLTTGKFTSPPAYSRIVTPEFVELTAKHTLVTLGGTPFTRTYVIHLVAPTSGKAYDLVDGGMSFIRLTELIDGDEKVWDSVGGTVEIVDHGQSGTRVRTSTALLTAKKGGAKNTFKLKVTMIVYS